nr:retrovirus-related Pol polyprotein from transposon TNT 1-94 [Tanacetum cinerariifolium]
MDLCGQMRIASINGKWYVLVIVDDYSRYTWVHFLRSKDEALEVIKTFLKRISILLQSPVIFIRTDSGTKFKNQVLKEYFDSVGISHQVSSVRTPQQNGVVERKNRTLVEAARTILIFSRAPLFLWAKSIATIKPDISFLHVFGTLCYPKNDHEDIGKLGAKGDIGFFIGYSADSCAFRVYNRRTKKIIETMNVSFDELSAMAFEQRSELDLLFEAMYDDYIGRQPSADSRSVSVAQAHQVSQTSTTTTSIADTAPTPTNSSSQAEKFPNNSQDVDELRTQQQAQQQGNQASLQSKTVADNVSNAMFDANTFVNPFPTSSTSATESSSQNVDPSNMHTFYQPYPHEFKWTKDHHLEQNAKEVMTDHAWIESMQKELLQFKRIDVWVLVPTPDNISPLTLKWMFKNKNDEEKMVIQKKSRLVVREYRQEEGLDFEESFAPALYGLKQAPRARYDELSKFLLHNHFFKGTIDPTLFIRGFDDDILVVQVYVDDIIFGYTHPMYTKLFFNLMKSGFEMSMMGEMMFFLGLQVNQSPCGIFINQSNYVLEILKKYGMKSCDPVVTPIEIKDKLDLDQNGTPVDAMKYRSMIGALMYLTSSRPDIVHATCLCARYQAKPTKKHLKEVKRIFCYLRGTVNTGLCLSPHELDRLAKSQ